MCRHVRVVTTLMNDIQNVTYPRPRRPAQNKQLHLLQIKHLASASVCYCKLPHCYVCENDGPSLPGLLVHLNLYSVIIIRLAAACIFLSSACRSFPCKRSSWTILRAFVPSGPSLPRSQSPMFASSSAHRIVHVTVHDRLCASDAPLKGRNT